MSGEHMIGKEWVKFYQVPLQIGQVALAIN